MLARIETDGLLELIWTAPLAALTVSLTFAVCIHGVARSNDSRRAGEPTKATLYGALALLAALSFAGAVLFGLLVITGNA